MRFALLEAKMALIELLKRYTFVRTPDTEVSLHKQLQLLCTLNDLISDLCIIPTLQVPLQTVNGITLSPKNGIYLKVVNRS